MITMKGIIRNYVEFKPTMANFGRIAEGKTKNLEIHVKGNLEERLKLSVVKGNGKGIFKTKLKRLSPTEYLLKLTIKAGHKSGSVNEMVKLKTNIKQQPSLELRTMAWIVSRVNAQPSRLMVNRNIPRDLRRFVRISNLGDTPVKVLEAKADSPDINVTLNTTKVGKSYNLLVNIKKGYKFPPGGNNITVKTDDTEIPSLTIPIVPFDRPQRRVNKRVIPQPPRVINQKVQPVKPQADGKK